MKAKLLKTDDSVGLAFLRVALGAVLFAHGGQKLFGWWGGYGFEGTMAFFTESMGIPWFLALAVILLESVGALALIAGLFTRPLAVAVAVLMAVAVYMVHLPFGFFMNWFGGQAGEGFEFHLLAIGMALALAIEGAGSLSLDRLLLRGSDAL